MDLQIEIQEDEQAAMVLARAAFLQCPEKRLHANALALKRLILTN
jgi:hypothetical protein